MTITSYDGTASTNALVDEGRSLPVSGDVMFGYGDCPNMDGRCVKLFTPEMLRIASELGSAAILNAGTGAGNIPVLDGGSKLDASLLPTNINISNISGLQTSLDGKLTANQPITLSGDATGSGATAIAVTLANSGVSANTYKNVTVDAKGRVTAGQNYSFTNNPSRSFVTTAAAANGFQISASRDAMINYSVSIATATTLAGSTSGTVVLEIAATNSSNAGDWAEVARSTNGQSVSLAIAITLNQTTASSLSCILPAGYYARLRSINNSGTPSYTFNSGQEVLI